MSDVVLRQKVGIPAGIDERVVDAGILELLNPETAAPASGRNHIKT